MQQSLIFKIKGIISISMNNTSSDACLSGYLQEQDISNASVAIRIFPGV